MWCDPRRIGVGLEQPSDHTACKATPDGLARGSQVFTWPTLSMINKTIVGRSKDVRPLRMRVVGLDD